MSERGQSRGGGGGRGGSGRGGRGGNDRGQGRGGNRQTSTTQSGNTTAEKPKKENILNLTKYLDKEINVEFIGGRVVVGTLKGFDQLMNLVMDVVKETMRDDEGQTSLRSLGLVVVRGPMITVVTPVDGSEVIANPFAQEDEE